MAKYVIDITVPDTEYLEFVAAVEANERAFSSDELGPKKTKKFWLTALFAEARERQLRSPETMESPLPRDCNRFNHVMMNTAA